LCKGRRRGGDDDRGRSEAQERLFHNHLPSVIFDF
jgi:hypothetical protein